MVCSNTIENSKVLQNYKIGLLTENNSKSITEAIIELSSKNKTIFEDEMIRAINNYNWESQESKISSIITA